MGLLLLNSRIAFRFQSLRFGVVWGHCFRWFSLCFSMIFALGRSWAVLGGLGRSWVALGSSWGGLGSLLGGLESLLGGLGSLLGRPGAVLERSWGDLGSFSVLPWAQKR